MHSYVDVRNDRNSHQFFNVNIYYTEHIMQFYGKISSIFCRLHQIPYRPSTFFLLQRKNFLESEQANTSDDAHLFKRFSLKSFLNFHGLHFTIHKMEHCGIFGQHKNHIMIVTAHELTSFKSFQLHSFKSELAI